MQEKFEINWTKIKGGCQSGRKVVTHDSKSDLPQVGTLPIILIIVIKLKLIHMFLDFSLPRHFMQSLS